MSKCKWQFWTGENWIDCTADMAVDWLCLAELFGYSCYTVRLI